MADASIWKPGSTTALVNAETSSLSENFVAGDAQTLFTLTNFQYVVGTGSLEVYVNGVYQRAGTDFTETSSSSFTLAFECDADDIVVAKGLVGSTNTASAAASAAAAAASAVLAQTAVTDATNQATASYNYSVDSANSAAASAASALASSNSAADSAISAAASQASADASAVSAASAASYASVGFDVASTIYDFGFITDTSLTFTTDYGSVA